MDILLAPGDTAEPQGQVVQGGGQLYLVIRGVGQGGPAGKPGQAPDHWRITKPLLRINRAGVR